MFKKFFGGLVGATLFAGAANAANCADYTYTLTNGTTASADQVMGNFNLIRDCVNLGTMTTPLNLNPPSATPLSLILQGNAHNNMPPANWGGGIGVNYSNGSGEVNFWNINASSARSFEFLQRTAAGATSLILIQPGGNVGIGTTAPSNRLFVNGTAGGTSAWASPSDARLKKDIQPLSDGLEVVTKLSPVRFQWRAPGEREVGAELNLPLNEPQIGFIAQEVEAVLPEAVTAAQPGSPDIYRLKEDNIIPVLVQAIKEQQAEIAQLMASVQMVKAVNAELLQRIEVRATTQAARASVPSGNLQ